MSDDDDQTLQLYDEKLKRWQDYRETFRTPAGQAVLRDLLDYCGVAHPAPLDGGSDRTQRFEGRRDVAIRIMRNLEERPERLFAMAMREAHDDEG